MLAIYTEQKPESFWTLCAQTQNVPDSNARFSITFVGPLKQKHKLMSFTITNIATFISKFILPVVVGVKQASKF
jgi:hypothetical protein